MKISMTQLKIPSAILILNPWLMIIRMQTLVKISMPQLIMFSTILFLTITPQSRHISRRKYCRSIFDQLKWERARLTEPVYRTLILHTLSNTHMTSNRTFYYITVKPVSLSACTCVSANFRVGKHMSSNHSHYYITVKPVSLSVWKCAPAILWIDQQWLN